MCTHRVDGKWSYYGADGAQAFGWTKIRGTWYYLDPSTGWVHTGWRESLERAMQGTFNSAGV